MKKSELIKLIKEELQKKLDEASPSGYGGTDTRSADGQLHKRNDEEMVSLLRSCTTLLKQIAQNTSKSAPPTNMSGGE